MLPGTDGHDVLQKLLLWEFHVLDFITTTTKGRLGSPGARFGISASPEVN